MGAETGTPTNPPPCEGISGSAPTRRRGRRRPHACDAGSRESSASGGWSAFGTSARSESHRKLSVSPSSSIPSSGAVSSRIECSLALPETALADDAPARGAPLELPRRRWLWQSGGAALGFRERRLPRQVMWKGSVARHQTSASRSRPLPRQGAQAAGDEAARPRGQHPQHSARLRARGGRTQRRRAAQDRPDVAGQRRLCRLAALAWVVVLDNLAAHKIDGGRQAIATAGASIAPRMSVAVPVSSRKTNRARSIR
jgi:hypothetical protein